MSRTGEENVLKMKLTVFWDVEPCSLIQVYVSEVLAASVIC
jgi:hypothetical protein